MSLRRTAFHEAGHAIAAMSVGLTVESITLTPGAPGARPRGCCVLADDPATPEDALVVLYAAEAAAEYA